MRSLRPHQEKALAELSSGSVLVGGTGSGKSVVALAYFYSMVLGGSIDPPTLPIEEKSLFVITTAKKRDDLDWGAEATHFMISETPGVGLPGVRLKVDSWNNIQKYVGVKNAFFIFDEQRAISYGSWSKAFIKISKNNKWILLTATPADRWIDLMPVFIANGFYKNATHFKREHVEYAPYVTYPSIRRYHGISKLKKLKDSIFVLMPYEKKVKSRIVDIKVEHDQAAVDDLAKNEWNHIKDRPVRNLPEYMSLLRQIINSDKSRLVATKAIHDSCDRLIIFYNYTFELNALRIVFSDEVVGEYNGEKHEPVPVGDRWVYLVQYSSGSEAWECFSTNHMLFYSLNYSYRTVTQAMGRINRLTSPYSELFYYRLISESTLDKAILRSQDKKQKFNYKNFLRNENHNLYNRR